MYTARFYHEETYLFSKIYQSLNDIQERAFESKLKAEVFTEDFEKIRIFNNDK